MNRSILIDAIKVLASQVIVLHHLSLYAPMADTLAAAWPGVLAFIQDEGPLAVQSFLVIGGYLAAMALGRWSRVPVGRLIWRRYLRLLPPLLVALLLVLLATWMVGDALATQEWVSPWPSLGTLVAHLLLLQDVLGIPSLSAGAWYVAIDLQLYGLFVLLAYACARASRPLAESWAPVIVALGTVASVHVFSRLASLEAWAIHFLASYGLGALVAWSRESARARRWLVWVVLLMALDWWADPRERTVVSLLTAAALLAWSRIGRDLDRLPLQRLLGFWGDASYSIFVCHFAAILLVSGLWERLGLRGLGWAAAFALWAWLLSLGFGVAVMRLVEGLGRRRDAVPA